MKMKKATKPKRCYHTFGPWQSESDEVYRWRVCTKCRRTRFECDKRVL